MSSTKLLTAIIEKEGDGYIALCLGVDVASQGDTEEQARSNLKEALESSKRHMGGRSAA